MVEKLRKKREGLHLAVMDSGLGGLSVLRQLVRAFPHNAYSYFGDSKNAPYGDRSLTEMKALTQSMLETVLSLDIDGLVIACNTISVYFSQPLAEKLDFPVIGTLQAGCREALSLYEKVRAEEKRKEDGADIAVMATPITIQSHAYWKGLQALRPNLQIEELACPHLVPAIEGDGGETVIRRALEEDLLDKGRPRLTAPVVLLACTHFPLIRPAIQKLLGPETHLADPAEGMVKDLARALSLNDAQRKGKKAPTGSADEKSLPSERAEVRVLRTSGHVARLKQMAEKVLAPDPNHYPYRYEGF